MRNENGMRIAHLGGELFRILFLASLRKDRLEAERPLNRGDRSRDGTLPKAGDFASSPKERHHTRQGLERQTSGHHPHQNTSCAGYHPEPEVCESAKVA